MVLSIILLCSAVTIVIPTGCCYYCPFCPPPSDTPIENPAPTPIPVRPTGGQYENPNLMAYIDDTISSSGEHNVVIVDVRSPEKYTAGHIPGAINLPWYSFRWENGVLIPLKQAAEKLGENGISRENRVIVYSDTCKPCGGLPASSYVAWMLEYLGQENVSVLDGGFDAWNTTYGCTKSVTRRPPTTYIPKTREDKFADTDWVQNNLNNTRVQIVDARSITTKLCRIFPLNDADRDGRYIGEWKLSRFVEIGTYCVSITATDRRFNSAGIEDAADFVIRGSF